MKRKRVIRVCAGILSAFMMLETVAADSLTTGVYAQELATEAADASQTPDEQELLEESEDYEDYEEEALFDNSSKVIIFDLDGGTLAYDATKLVEARYEISDASSYATVREAIKAQADFGSKSLEEVYKPTKQGYTFKGWKDSTGADFSFDAPLNGDVTAYAQWETNKSMTVAVAVSGNPATVYDYDKIVINATEPGATIYYKVGSDTATTADSIYNGELSIKELLGGEINTQKTLKIAALAVKNGVEDATTVGTYTVNPDWGDVAAEDRGLIKDGFWVKGISKNDREYDGKAVTFDNLKVYRGKKLLKEGTDYTISYKNNVKAYEKEEGSSGFDAAKAPAVVITGKGNYSGTYSEYFVIKRVPVSDVTIENVSLLYNGKVQKGVPKLTYKGMTLKNGTDFKVEYTSTGTDVYKAVGDYDIKITGLGNYCETVTAEGAERITDKSIAGASVVGAGSLVFDPEYKQGSNKYWIHSALQIKAKNGEYLSSSDYEVIYPTEPPKIGTTSFTIVGKGEYGGSLVVKYNIIAPSKDKYINMADLYYTGLRSTYEYDGKPCDQSGYVEVYPNKEMAAQKEGKLIYDTDGVDDEDDTKDKDYIIELKKGTKGVDNIDPGTITLVFKGIKAPYYGEKELTFTITPSDISKWDSKDSTKNNISATNEAILVDGIAENKVVIYFGDPGKRVKLIENKDYTLSYKNNGKKFSSTDLTNNKISNSIKPSVTITGIGKFKGSTVKYFSIDGENFSGVRVCPADKLYTEKAGNFKTTVTVTDALGKVLTVAKDYKKDIFYYYVDDTVLDDGTLRKAGDKVEDNDIVPVDTIIRVQVTPTGDYGQKDPEDGKDRTIDGIYRIIGKDISEATIKIPSQFYTGREITPIGDQLVVTYDKRILSEYDYEIVGYENNINVGTAKVTIKGIGDFGGTKTATFSIVKEALGKSISFNGNGATSGSMENQSITSYGTAAKPTKITKNAYKRSNYTFVGWNTLADGTGTAFADNVAASDLDAFLKNGRALVLYAQWKPTEYKISYNSNGGPVDLTGAPTVYTPETGTFTLPLPEISTWPKGYMFGGWYKEDSYKTRIVKVDKGSFGDLNLYAKWVPYTYTVSFDANVPTGSCPTKMADEVISYNVEKALSTNKFSVKNYAFAGWSTDKNSTEKMFSNGQSITNKDLNLEPVNNIDVKITLYAVWKQKFVVTFDENGGNPVDDIEYVYGEGTKLPTPVREGYTFGGWYTDNTFKTKLSSVSNKAATQYNLIAKWTPIKYTIAFNKNASKDISGSVSSMSMAYDAEKSLNANKFVRKGYRFAGWNTQADGNGTDYSDGQPVKNLLSKNGAKITLYAQWEETYYTINYNYKGTMVDTNPVTTYNYGDERSLPTLTREGYVFGGWYTDKACTKKLASIKKTQSGDLELYAKWVTDKNNYAERQYDITVVKEPAFSWNGDEIADKYTYGQTITFPNGSTAPTREGYKFAGWYTDSSFKKSIKGIGAKTQDDITLYAKWTPLTYSVTYKVNAPAATNPKNVTGKDVVQKNYKYETDTVLRKNSFKVKGYTFKGWATTAGGAVKYTNQEKIKGDNTSGSLKYGDVTLYAVWERDTYSIIYNNVDGISNNNPSSYNVDEAVVLKQPSSIGKTFLGWYSDSACKEKVTSIAVGSTGNKTFYAKWGKNIYNIYYNTNDDGDTTTKVENGLVGYVTNYTKTTDNGYLLPKATRRGYTLVGWSTDKKGTSPMLTLKKAPACDMTLYAKWNPIKYNITYYIDEKENEKATYSISTKNQKLKVEVIYGYEMIEKWHVGSSSGDETNVIKAGTIGDLKLYAVKTPITYSVEYDVNGAPFNAPKSTEDVTGLAKFTLPKLGEWKNHTFKGWKIGDKVLPAGKTVDAKDLELCKSIKVKAVAVWDTDATVDLSGYTELGKKIYNLSNTDAFRAGKAWGSSVSYHWPEGNLDTKGSLAFATQVSDKIYGTSAPVYRKEKDKSVTVGSVVMLKDNHAAVVMKIDSKGYTLAEGDYNGFVTYGRTITKTDFNNQLQYFYTRSL